ETFIQADALQCGFCTSGMVMSCKALLDRHPRPSRAQIAEAVAGNLCRCGTYPHVFDAVERAAGIRTAEDRTWESEGYAESRSPSPAGRGARGAPSLTPALRSDDRIDEALGDLAELEEA